MAKTSCEKILSKDQLLWTWICCKFKKYREKLQRKLCTRVGFLQKRMDSEEQSHNTQSTHASYACNGQYGKASHERGTFCKTSDMWKGWESVISVCKKSQRCWQVHCLPVKIESRENVLVLWLIHILKSVYLPQLTRKGYYLYIKVTFWVKC